MLSAMPSGTARGRHSRLKALLFISAVPGGAGLRLQSAALGAAIGGLVATVDVSSTVVQSCAVLNILACSRNDSHAASAMCHRRRASPSACCRRGWQASSQMTRSQPWRGSLGMREKRQAAVQRQEMANQGPTKSAASTAQPLSSSRWRPACGWTGTGHNDDTDLGRVGLIAGLKTG